MRPLPSVFLISIIVLGACSSPPVDPRVTIHPPDVAAAGAGEQIHVLAAGEELKAIAATYGCTVEWLINRNAIVSRQDLTPGRKLIVPAK